MIKKLLQKMKRRTLRDVYVELYGEKFGELYDNLARGYAIGGFDTTAEFLMKLELARMVSNDAEKKLRGEEK